MGNEKLKIFIFGAKGGYQKIKPYINYSKCKILGFLDNSIINEKLEYNVFNPDILKSKNVEFDMILIASTYFKEISNQLIKLGVQEEKIFNCFGGGISGVIIPFLKLIKENVLNFSYLFSIDKNIEFLSNLNFMSRSKDYEEIIFTHYLEGGSKEFLKQYKQSRKNYIELIEFYMSYIIFDEVNQVATIIEAKKEVLNEFLTQMNVKLIFVNQLVTHSMDTIWDFLIDTSIPIHFFIHDYYCVCPSFKLINSDFKYCNAEQRIDKCKACLENSKVIKYTDNTVPIDIEKWREKFNTVLNKSTVHAPSNYTKKIINNYYPDVNITVLEHKKIFESNCLFKEENAKKEVLRIGILGNITKEKGLLELEKIVENCNHQKMPIEFYVIGKLSSQNLKKYKNIYVSGEYNKNYLSKIVEERNLSIFLLLSIWPETFCYVADEIREMGFPIITYNIGAHAERIKDKDAGWLIDLNSDENLVNLLHDLNSNRYKIINKARGIKK